MSTEAPYFDIVQDLLNRMARAQKRGTGCHISAEEIQALNVTAIGQLWGEPDPRNVPASSINPNKEAQTP